MHASSSLQLFARDGIELFSSFFPSHFLISWSWSVRVARLCQSSGRPSRRRRQIVFRFHPFAGSQYLCSSSVSLSDKLISLFFFHFLFLTSATVGRLLCSEKIRERCFSSDGTLSGLSIPCPTLSFLFLQASFIILIFRACVYFRVTDDGFPATAYVYLFSF